MTGLRRPLLPVLMAAALLVVPGGAHAAKSRAFDLQWVRIRTVEGVYRLDALARLHLTDPVRRALGNGVALTVTWRIAIDRERSWWFDADVAELTQRYRIEYHELTRQYLVTNRNTGVRRSFVHLETALETIGALVGFPVVDRMLLDPPRDHTGHVRVSLDRSALPLPLRLMTLFSSAWDLESEWLAWSFE